MRLQIGLVANKQGDDVWARVLAQLFDPSLDTSESRSLRDIIHQQCTDSSAIIPARDELSAACAVMGQGRGVRCSDGAISHLSR